MRLVSVIVLALAVLHALAAGATGVGSDEAYYWLWSRYPEFGYFDHPPMVAWWIWLGTHLFGDGGFGIRIVFVLATIAVSLAVYLTGRTLFGAPIAERATLWFNVSILVGVAGFLATPDIPSTLFWSLAILAFALVVKTGRGPWWLLVGLAAGLGAASKYTDLFLGPGLLLALALDRDLRRWFKSPWLWAGGAVAGLAFAPVISWNYTHGFVSFAKQFGRLAVDGVAIRYIGELILGQFGLLNPFVAIFVGRAAWQSLARRAMPYRRETGILLATTLPLALYMLFHAIHARVGGNWLAPIYPTLALAAAAAADRPVGEGAGDRFLAFVRRAVMPVGIASAVIGFAYLATPLDVKPLFPDPAQTFRGWREFADEVEATRRENGAGWIATTDYGVNAELAYQLRRADASVDQVTSRVRYAFAPAPDAALLGEPALIVVGPSSDIPMLSACFGGLARVSTVVRRGPGNSSLQKFDLYLGNDPKPGILAAGCEGEPQMARR